MKRILTAVLAAAMVVSTAVGFSVSASAEEETHVIPQVSSAPTMDGIKDEIYSTGYTWSVDVDSAPFVDAAINEETGDFEFPKTPASATYTMVWYDGEADPTYNYEFIDELEDDAGGLYLFADVKDYSRAWATGNAGDNSIGFTPKRALWDGDFLESYGVPENTITDSLYVLLDPADYNATEQKYNIGYGISPYSSYVGNGNILFPIPFWFEYLNWGNNGGVGGSGSLGYLEKLIHFTVRSTVDYEFSEDHPMPDKATTRESKYVTKALEAYQYAEIKGYTLEIFIPWAATLMGMLGLDMIDQFIKPTYGYQFGMGLMLLDNYYDYATGDKPSNFEDVQKYVRGNCALFDFCGDMEFFSDYVIPSNYNTYLIGDAEGKVPGDDVVKGDIDGNGEIKLADAMMAFNHVAKVITLDENQSKAADCNSDGEVKLADAMAIFKYVAKVTDTVIF